MKKKEILKQLDTLTVNIQGYLADAKLFGFEPVELESMKEKKQQLEKSLKTFELS